MKTRTQNTPATVSTLRHTITKLSKDGKEKTIIRISLDDECQNGHEDFSLTADIYEQRPNGRWVGAGGGCCHDHILKLCPELAPFAALHLSTFDGVPMHAFSTAWYWFQVAFPAVATSQYHGGTGSSAKSPEDFTAIFKEHTRITPEAWEALLKMSPRSEKEMQYALETLNLPEQWKQEAKAAITTLEEWSGHKFESKATRTRYEPLTAEEIQEIEHRHATGYYEPERIAARDAEARAARKQAKLDEIDKDLQKDIKEKEADAKVKRFLVRHDLKENVIYYSHTNNVTVNWKNWEAKYTQDEFDHLVKLATEHAEELPEGVTFTFQASPKY